MTEERTQCPSCKFWFRSLAALANHICYGDKNEISKLDIRKEEQVQLADSDS